jgi:hypothetical protein
MRLPYLPPIPFMPSNIPTWLSYLLVFAAAVIIVLIIVKLMFKYATSASGAILAITLILLFIIGVFLVIDNSAEIIAWAKRIFGPIL